MEEENQLPLKRVELSLSKFNEVAIPHHLDLLRQHKANIIKYEESGQYSRVRAEQTHARRVAARLRALLAELEALRRRVRAADRARFDRLTQRARDLTLRAIVDYRETQPLSINRPAEIVPEVSGSAVSTESVGVLETESGQLLALRERDAELREREAVLRGWTELQAEVRALHDAWQHVQAAALAQADRVADTAADVDAAAGNVRQARKQLSIAERLGAGGVGAATGALAGALVGGPLGLVLGAKAGAGALAAGSALGYAASCLLAARRRQLRDERD